MSLLTVFTSPKPFTHSAHINMIQRNTLQALTHLGPEVEVLLIGDEEGMVEAAAETGVRHVSGVVKNQYGTPLISSIFDLARRQKWHVVDVTPSITMGHQNHDYSHLPQNKPPYRLPESQENIRLGGGRRTIFGVDDATHQLAEGRLRRYPLSWYKFWREVEISPLLTLRSFLLAQVTFALLHPRRAFFEWRPQLSRIKSALLQRMSL